MFQVAAAKRDTAVCRFTGSNLPSKTALQTLSPSVQVQKMRPAKLRPTLLILAAFSALLTACGGGGATANTTALGNSAPAIAVSVTPASAILQTGGSLNLSATVSQTSNQNVTWSVNGVPGGSPSAGVITTALDSQRRSLRSE
jgi:Na+/proline symporter